MKECQLSIIIPVFNQFEYVKKCLISLEKIKDVSYEIIAVNDASTDLETVELLKQRIGQINLINNKTNVGFIQSCKIGANEAIGKYLCFLNSDTELIEPLSFKNMVDCFEKRSKVGVVGAKLLLPNNTIQHAGMVYNQGQMNFVHRCYGVDRNDPRVCVTEEVESVTGACYITTKELWNELNGWDDSYGKGYFEDSDFSLRIREKGLKVIYCADAIFYHAQSKSFQGGPSQIQFSNNWEIFKQKWIRRKEGIKFFSYPKIVACYILFNEEDYIEYSLKSIYDFVDKIMIVEGATKAVYEFANEDGSSSDKTNEILNNFPDPENKIRIIHGKFNDKTEQRNVYCQFLEGMDYVFVIDGDEVWDKQTLLKIEHLIFARPDIPAFCFNFKDFWQDFSHISKGIWTQFTGRKSLINLNLTGGLKYNNHILPLTKDGKDIPAAFCKDISFFHYSYARPDKKIKQKINYYLKNGTPGYNIRKDWYEIVWMGWKQDKIKVENEFGTHPFGLPSFTELWKEDHPEVMKSHPLYEKYLQDTQLRYYITTTPKEMKFWKNKTVSNDDLFKLDDNIYAIIADCVLEKFPHQQIAELLVSWFAKLKVGGELIVLTPNFNWIVKNYVDKNLSYMDTVLRLFGNQSNDFEFNSILFDEQAIGTLLNEVGFSKINIEIIENGMFFKVHARKEKEI